jgi:hypothetical protein
MEMNNVKKTWMILILEAIAPTFSFAEDLEVKVDGFILPTYIFATGGIPKVCSQVFFR